MEAAVKIGTDATTISRKVLKIADDVNDPKTMLEVAGVAKALIVQRTLLGQDVTGAPFIPYSTEPFYAPINKRPAGYKIPQGGRKTRGGKSVFYPGGWRQYKAAQGHGGTPNLSVSGEMLGDIQTRARPGVGTLYLGGTLSAAKAHGHHFGTVVPERRWFDIGDRPVEVAALEQQVAAMIQRYVTQQGLN